MNDPFSRLSANEIMLKNECGARAPANNDVNNDAGFGAVVCALFALGLGAVRLLAALDPIGGAYLTLIALVLGGGALWHIRQYLVLRRRQVQQVARRAGHDTSPRVPRAGPAPSSAPSSPPTPAPASLLASEPSLSKPLPLQ